MRFEVIPSSLVELIGGAKLSALGTDWPNI
jgi:hypothetical protein